VVIVSHDFDEAITLADRVLVLAGRPGRIVGQVAVTIEGTRKRETMEFRRIRAQLADLFHTADQGAAALTAAG